MWLQTGIENWQTQPHHYEKEAVDSRDVQRPDEPGIFGDLQSAVCGVNQEWIFITPGWLIRRSNIGCRMTSISELAIGKQRDIVNQRSLLQSFNKGCPTWGRGAIIFEAILNWNFKWVVRNERIKLAREKSYHRLMLAISRGLNNRLKERGKSQ